MAVTRLVHERNVRHITKLLARTSTYTDLQDSNGRLSTCIIVYWTDKEKVRKCYIDSDFDSGWDQTDYDNVEKVM